MFSTQSLQKNSVIYVVDNDQVIRESFAHLLGKNGYNVSCYENAECFLKSLSSHRKQVLSCALLDVNLNDISGIELQQKLKEKDIKLPIAFVTDHSEIAIAVEAIKKGAYDYIQKPIKDDDLFSLVNQMLSKAQKDTEKTSEIDSIRSLFKTLTSREQQILDLIVGGYTNKGISLELGISIKTVEQHRSNIMEKLQVKGRAKLMHLVYKHQINHA